MFDYIYIMIVTCKRTKKVTSTKYTYDLCLVSPTSLEGNFDYSSWSWSNYESSNDNEKGTSETSLEKR